MYICRSHSLQESVVHHLAAKARACSTSLYTSAERWSGVEVLLIQYCSGTEHISMHSTTASLPENGMVVVEVVILKMMKGLGAEQQCWGAVGERGSVAPDVCSSLGAMQ